MRELPSFFRKKLAHALSLRIIKKGGEFMEQIESRIIERTFRVPLDDGGRRGDGSAMGRQLDSALMSVGFKLSGELLAALSGLHPVIVKERAIWIMATVRAIVGDHVRHNVYFKDFPENVPDTFEFWSELISSALLDPRVAGTISLQLSFGYVNLLDLPKYGHYLHSYEEMVAAHEKFMPLAKDRITILHKGRSLPEEALALYRSLAESAVPLNESDRQLLADLAEVCVSDPQPNRIPVRENKAVINRVRMAAGKNLLVDTVTDVLRLAAALSGGDVTLQEGTKFKSFSRPERRALLVALDAVVGGSAAKLQDVGQHAEVWKRLGERLHPYEHKQYSESLRVFAVARGKEKAPGIAARAEVAFGRGRLTKAASILSEQPGMLFRSVDRIVRSAGAKDWPGVLREIKDNAEGVSTRVLLSLREHLENRLEKDAARVFANSKGRAWVMPDTRKPLTKAATKPLLALLDKEISERLGKMGHLVVDGAVLGLALPLSDKNKPRGFGIMPRGSIVPVSGQLLRFFVYWKQRDERTDYDLSILFLDENFLDNGQVSWTNLRGDSAKHSGDITEAPAGASEFIDIDLGSADCRYIVPQVNVYSGEAFGEIEESFFGFMSREEKQRGLPFEPRTVRMKSDLSGKGKVALPLVFCKARDGSWSAKWMHLYLKGMPNCNRIEANRASTALLIRMIVSRQYLTMGYLVDMLKGKAGKFNWHDGKRTYQKPITYIGVDKPENLPYGSKTYTPMNMSELIR